MTESTLIHTVRACILMASTLFLMSCAVNPPIAGKDLRKQALPQLSIPNQFSAGINTSSQLDDAWLKQFNDSELEALVAEALKNHPDVRIIAARRL